MGVSVGLAVENFTPQAADPSATGLVEYAIRAEELGFDSLWAWDHLFLGARRPFPFFEALTTLTWLAAHTRAVTLGTGVLVLPLRDPTVLAKVTGTLQLVSGGRLALGVAAGWYEREFDATGVPFRGRGQVFAGVGMPLLASGLAQRRQAPHLTIVLEGGIIGSRPRPGKLPISTNEMRAAYGAPMLTDITDIFLYAQRGFFDYGFLGAAQVDRYGNINTSFISDPDNPKVRLPGSGGAADIISLCAEIFIVTSHERRRFVDRVDFITSPGYLTGGESRRAAGLTSGMLRLAMNDAEQPRIGLMIPSSNTMMEADFARELPAGWTLHTARMYLEETTAAGEYRMLDEFALPAARDIGTARPHVVVFGCTSAGALRGNDYDSQLCERISERTGAPTISTIQSVRTAIERSGARRVGIITPYVDELNDRIRASIEADGVEVARIAGLGMTQNFQIARVPAQRIIAFAAEQLGGLDIDLVFASCTNFGAMAAIGELAALLHRPVVTSNQAVLAAAVERARAVAAA